MNKEKCALKLVNEIIQYYDARSRKHQTTSWSCLSPCIESGESSPHCLILFDICLNNIILSDVRFLECSLSFRFCHYNSVCTSSCLQCVPDLPPISTFSDIIPPYNICSIVQIAHLFTVQLSQSTLSTYTYFHLPVLQHTLCGRPGFASKRYQSNYVFYYVFGLHFFFLIYVAQVSKFRNINLCIPKVRCPATNNPRLNAVLIHILTPYFRYIPFNIILTCTLVGRHSSVGIATPYGLDGPGIESRWKRDFPHLSRTALGAYPVSVTMGAESFPGVKRPGRGVD